MVLNNVPSEIQQGIDLAEAMKNVTATVTYEQDVVKDVTADQLVFNSIPDISDPGKKTLVVMYAKTTNGAAANNRQDDFTGSEDCSKTYKLLLLQFCSS